MHRWKAIPDEIRGNKIGPKRPKLSGPIERSRVTAPASHYTQYETVVQLLTAKGSTSRPGGAGTNWQCPAHDDRAPSLTVTEGEDGKALLHCHADCEYDEVMTALGLQSVHPIRLRCAELMQACRDRTWTGRTGRTDQKVYFALALRGLIAATFDVDYSCRALAEATGIGKETASKALHRLEKLKLITLLKYSPSRDARTIRLNEEGVRLTGHMGFLLSYGMCPVTRTPINPGSELGVFLRDTGIAVYHDGLDAEPRSAAEIARLTHVSRKSVTRRLKQLETLRLAAREGEGWKLGSRDLSEDPYLPEETGALKGRVEIRRQRWQEEREFFAWKMEDWSHRKHATAWQWRQYTETLTSVDKIVDASYCAIDRKDDG
jgi:DNA-binding MarR family transcriptional regulator